MGSHDGWGSGFHSCFLSNSPPPCPYIETLPILGCSSDGQDKFLCWQLVSSRLTDLPDLWSLSFC